MVLEERPISEINAAIRTNDFEAVLAPTISGPSVLRPALWWHSQGTRNTGFFKSQRVDEALELLGHAATDAQYQDDVVRFQKAIIDDPPAIFLAWDQRARAISERFAVVPAESGGDIFGTLRLWRLNGSGTAN
jgi:hypothetical protein